MVFVLGLTLLACIGMMQSSAFNRGLGFWSSPTRLHKAMPFDTFQIGYNESLRVRIVGDRPKGPGLVANSAPHDQRKTLEIKDNLKWHDTPAEKRRPNAWEWYRYSEQSEEDKKKTKKPRHRLLLAQYSNKNEFADIFEMTKPINKAYAEHWGHDIVFLNGQDLPTKDYNLATMLQLAWENKDKYDLVLLMDADAMMNNFRYDITRLFPFKEMMLAKRVIGRDDIHTWQVFSTVSIWNLNHLLTPRVQKTWSTRYAEEDPATGLSDQIKPYAETEVFTVTRQIENDNWAFIRTLQFATKNHGLRKVDPKVRKQRWAVEVKRACKRFRVDCTRGIWAP